MNSARILIVDDNRNLVVSLRDYLASEGYEVLTAFSAEEALDIAKHSEPDLVILDIGMPGMGGIGFLKTISTSADSLRYPVLVLTARAAMEQFFSTVPVNGFLAKPCDETRLLRSIREILAARAPRPDPEADRHPRVLLAQDDRAILADWRRAFLKAGYVVETAASGPEALESAMLFRPTAVVLTEILPGLNGSVLARLLRSMPAMRGVRTVLCDPSHSPYEIADPHLGVRAGVDRLLPTPCTDMIVRAVNTLLNRKEGGAPHP